MNDDPVRREPIDGIPEPVNIEDPDRDPLDRDDLDVDLHPDLGDLPVMSRSVLRRATWLGVLRSAAVAIVIVVVFDAVWTRVGAPAIATRHGRDRVIEEQIRGSLQSLSPSSLVAPPTRTVGRDGSLRYQFFLLDPVPGDNPRQRMFEFEVSSLGVVDVDDGAFSMAISSSETLRFRDASRRSAVSFVAAVSQLPPGAVVSFALYLPSPLDDGDAQALWRALDVDGVMPSGYLMAPDQQGNPRGWSGPELDQYRRWDAAMSRDDGVETGSSNVGITGANAGRAPDAAVIGLVYTNLPADRVAVAIDRTGATETASGPVGLSLEEFTSTSR
jgi:hypothetical protein